MATKVEKCGAVSDAIPASCDRPRGHDGHHSAWTPRGRKRFPEDRSIRIDERRLVAQQRLDAAAKRCSDHPDWLGEAWHFGPSATPNTHSGDLYIVDDEEGGFALVRRSYGAVQGDVIDGLLDIAASEIDELIAVAQVGICRHCDELAMYCNCCANCGAVDGCPCEGAQI